jgi:hypothetical protein
MMKSKFLLLALVGTFFVLQSCDRVTLPYIIKTDLDTNLYPGNFIDYEAPTFPTNTYAFRNVMIEDYTGHKCSFCPAAAVEAANLEAANPGRVFVATIHAGASPDGISDFQKTNASGSYTTDFTTTEGTEMAGAFYGMSVGLASNPIGTVNRINEGSAFFLSASVWGDSVATALTYSPDIRLQAISNYFPETNGAFIHVETEFINDMNGEFNIVGYVIKEHATDWQKVLSDDVPDYDHHNIHIGNLFGETWGRAVGNGAMAAGTKVYTDFSYEIPDGLTTDEIHFLIYVYDKSTYEVIQVIKHEL